MKDKRSIAAVDAAIAFGNGQIDENQLSAAYSAAASAFAAAAYSAANKKSQQETADICRKYLPIEVWNINNTTTPALEPGKNNG